jgi:hypothetical protein
MLSLEFYFLHAVGMCMCGAEMKKRFATVLTRALGAHCAAHVAFGHVGVLLVLVGTRHAMRCLCRAVVVKLPDLELLQQKVVAYLFHLLGDHLLVDHHTGSWEDIGAS